MPDFSLILPGIVFLAAVIGISKLKKKKKKKEATLVGVALGIFVVGWLGFMAYQKGLVDFKSPEPTDQYRKQYLVAAAEVLAKEITGKYPAQKILLIADKGYFENEDQMTLIEKFKKGVELMTSPDNVYVDYLDRASREKDGKIEYAPMSSTHFDNIVRKHWYCDLVVSLVGLPDDANAMYTWGMPANKRPNFAVLIGGGCKNLESQFKNKKIVGAVLLAPDKSIPESKPPEDVKQQFDSCFIFVTPENFDKMKERHKDLL